MISDVYGGNKRFLFNHFRTCFTVTRRFHASKWCCAAFREGSADRVPVICKSSKPKTSAPLIGFDQRSGRCHLHQRMADQENVCCGSDPHRWSGFTKSDCGSSCKRLILCVCKRSKGHTYTSCTPAINILRKEQQSHARSRSHRTPATHVSIPSSHTQLWSEDHSRQHCRCYQTPTRTHPGHEQRSHPTTHRALTWSGNASTLAHGTRKTATRAPTSS